MSVRAPLSRVVGALGNLSMLVPLAAELVGSRRCFLRAARDLDLAGTVAAAGGLSGARRAYLDIMLGLGLPFLFGTYCKLIGTRPSSDEYKALALYFALSAPYDDLFDKAHITAEHLQRVLGDPSYTPASSDERLTRELYRRLVALAPARDNARFHEAVRELHAAQLDSVHRLGPSSGSKLAGDVTYAKARATQAGAFALFRPASSPEERAAEAAMAAWLQLCDDALDRREDRAEGRETLLTRCRGFADAAELLERHRLDAFEKVGALRHLDGRRLREFRFRWYLVAATGMTFLYLDDRVERGELPAIRLREAVPLVCKLVADYRPEAAMRPIAIVPTEGRGGA